MSYPHQPGSPKFDGADAYEAEHGKKKPVRVRDVAKIIDPDAFTMPDDYSPTERERWAEFAPMKQAQAIEKARAIQKLLSH